MGGAAELEVRRYPRGAKRKSENLANTGGRVRMKRAKAQQAAETQEEPPPKKVRKVKAVPAPPPPKVEPSLLGSLPLYGEELPDGGYDNIPVSAKGACAELRDVLSKIHDLNDEGSGSKVGIIWSNSAFRTNLVEWDGPNAALSIVKSSSLIH